MSGTLIVPNAYSSQDRPDHFSRRIRQPVFAAIVDVRQSCMVDAEQVQNCCMNIVDRNGVDGGFPADFVGCAVAGAALDSAAGYPNAEAVWVVVAAFAFFAHGHAAEFAAPDDQRAVEQAALLEVGQQAGDRHVGFLAAGSVVFGEAAVGVPFVVAVNLHEPHAALDHAAGEQALVPNVFVPSDD